LVVWGFCISTTLLFHATATVNSLAHRMGRRRFQTKDDSRNSLFIALITFGEGWHNNHHYAPGSVRQGFRWWEIDMSFYALKAMSWLGMVGRMNPIPERAQGTASNRS
jgi:stearoyl-CoA desaturase (delta-9 desaturase)